MAGPTYRFTLDGASSARADVPLSDVARTVAHWLKEAKSPNHTILKIAVKFAIGDMVAEFILNTEPPEDVFNGPQSLHLLPVVADPSELSHRRGAAATDDQ